MLEFFEFVIGSFAALFPVTDPLGAVPVFLVLAAGISSELRHQLSLKIAIYTILVLISFLFLGGTVLNFFGISIAVVKIAGGIVVFETGWQTLKDEPTLSPQDEQEATEKVEHHEDISFIPMTIPLLAGPGSIAVTLGLAAQAGQTFSIDTGFNLLGATLAIVLIGIITYLCLRLSSWFLEVLGKIGITAISRFLGLFILAIGVKLILDGLTDWIVGFNQVQETSFNFFKSLSN